MRLSPSDLAKATFTKAPIGGYKHEEVNELLDRAAETLESLISENDGLRAQVSRLRTELESGRGEDRILQETLLSAQRAADLLRDDARREGEMIREEARRQALADRTEIQKEAERLQDDVGRLQLIRQRLLAEQRALLDRMTTELNSIERPANAVASVPVEKEKEKGRIIEFPRPAESDFPRIEPEVPVASVASSQTYPTRLPKNTKPMSPVIVEDEHGEKWVS